MQTFSSLQRNIIDKKFVSYLFLFLLFLYDNLSTIYSFLPQLLGIYFLIFINLLEDKKADYRIILFFILVLFYESNRDFPTFTLMFSFTFLYIFVLPIIDQYISCGKCKQYIYIVLSYLFYLIVSWVLGYMFHETIFEISFLWFLYYILLDLVVGVLK